MFKLITYSLFLSCTVCCFGTYKSTTHSLLTQIAEKVSESQINSGENAGIYKNTVSVHAPPSMVLPKGSNGHYDDNEVFVSFWITVPLLEASMYSGVQYVTSEQLLSALKVFQKAHDRNSPYNTSIIYFHYQIYNETADWWVGYNPNSKFYFSEILSEDDIRNYLQEKGFHETESLAKAISYRISQDTFTDLSGDFDSTSANLVLGSLLEEMKDMFPESRKYWKNGNSNLTSVTDSLIKYAYRPFVSDVRNATSPTSYYIMRYFLQKAEYNGNDVSICSTWAANEDESNWLRSHNKPSFFTTNDVDIAVCVNVIYAITAAILSDLLPMEVLDDPELQMLYLNTTAYIKHQILTQFSGRADLAMMYYASVNQFYWFTSRILSLIERFRLQRNLLHSAIVEVFDSMKEVLRGQATQDILSLVKPADNSDEIYFDGVLGTSATNTDVDDRLSMTSITLSALMNIWTVYDSEHKTLSWLKNTPSHVKQTVTSGCRWLEKNILGSQYKHENAFFLTGSPTPDDSRCWYPSSRLQYMNGTRLSYKGDFPNEIFIGAVEGVIPENEYEDMLNEKHFGLKTPRKFRGMEESFYVYWSSEAYTYATALLALTQFSVVRD